MATNPHFKRESVDQNLIEDLVVETIKMHGHDFLYIPRTLVNEDTLFGEDTISKFENAVEIEMYLSTVDGFEGEGEIISKLGFEIRDSMGVVVSRKRFAEEFAHLSDITYPREGDLLYFPLTNGLFEIKFVETENPFYQAGKLYTYDLSCELFRYSHEDFDTGDDRVDSVATDQVDSVTGGVTIPSDPFSDNTNIETMGDDIFDFTENDPFSEGDYK
tara:strand:- start:649 stop:1299 length:651 start_codon:yes stop_codon:yes gene_type:complete